MKFTGTIVPVCINFVLLKPSDENDEIIKQKICWLKIIIVAAGTGLKLLLPSAHPWTNEL